MLVYHFSKERMGCEMANFKVCDNGVRNVWVVEGIYHLGDVIRMVNHR